MFIVFFFPDSVLFSQETCKQYIGIYNDDLGFREHFASQSSTIRVFSTGFYTKSVISGMSGSGIAYFEIGYNYIIDEKPYFLPIMRRTSDMNIGMYFFHPDYRNFDIIGSQYGIGRDSLFDCIRIEQFENLRKSDSSTSFINLISGQFTGKYYLEGTEVVDETQIKNRDKYVNGIFNNTEIFCSYSYSYLSRGIQKEEIDSTFFEKSIVVKRSIENLFNEILLDNGELLLEEDKGTLIGIFDGHKDELIIYQNNLISDTRLLENIVRKYYSEWESKPLIIEIRRKSELNIEVRK